MGLYCVVQGQEVKIEVTCARGGFVRKYLQRERYRCGVERREEKRLR